MTDHTGTLFNAARAAGLPELRTVSSEHCEHIDLAALDGDDRVLLRVSYCGGQVVIGLQAHDQLGPYLIEREDLAYLRCPELLAADVLHVTWRNLYAYVMGEDFEPAGSACCRPSCSCRPASVSP